MKNSSRPKRFEFESQLKSRIRTFECPVEVVLAAISGKWKASILFHIRKGQLRYGALRKRMTRITPRMLALQLRELERDGIIYREVFPEVPPRVEYGLTRFGETLTPVLGAMAKWGKAMGWQGME